LLNLNVGVVNHRLGLYPGSSVRCPAAGWLVWRKYQPWKADGAEAESIILLNLAAGLEERLLLRHLSPYSIPQDFCLLTPLGSLDATVVTLPVGGIIEDKSRSKSVTRAPSWCAEIEEQQSDW
jgi:hypothetical protein